jgi:hypothetical protein
MYILINFLNVLLLTCLSFEVSFIVPLFFLQVITMSSIPKEYYKYGLVAGLGLAAYAEFDKLDIIYNTLGRDLSSIYRYDFSKINFKHIITTVMRCGGNQIA